MYINNTEIETNKNNCFINKFDQFKNINNLNNNTKHEENNLCTKLVEKKSILPKIELEKLNNFNLLLKQINAKQTNKNLKNNLS